MDVKIKILNEKFKCPEKAHGDDFAYDVYAVSEEEVAPNVWKYGLGFALQIETPISFAPFFADSDFFAKTIGFSLRPRSSVWKTGMVLSNCIGTVDHGYTGEISMVFYHVMPSMPRYKVGDKIGQIHLDRPCADITFNLVSELDETERGANGYGSSGK